MKKIFATILIVLSLFAFCCSPNAGTTKVAVFEEDSVATLTIFSYNGQGESKFGIKNLGHSFLCLTNTSSNNIVLAGKTVEPNEEIYFGAWSLSVHFGIWFNVESNYIQYYNKYNGRISVDKGINLEELELISDYILENDKWTPLDNCSKFAINLWNTVAKDSEKLTLYAISTPSKLIEELKLFENFKVNKPISVCNKCGYFADLSSETFEFQGGEAYA